jgi:hypothetical protein
MVRILGSGSGYSKPHSNSSTGADEVAYLYNPSYLGDRDQEDGS